MPARRRVARLRVPQACPARRARRVAVLAIPAGETLHASLRRLSRAMGVSAVGALFPSLIVLAARPALHYHAIRLSRCAAGRACRFVSHVSIMHGRGRVSRAKCTHVCDYALLSTRACGRPAKRAPASVDVGACMWARARRRARLRHLSTRAIHADMRSDARWMSWHARLPASPRHAYVSMRASERVTPSSWHAPGGPSRSPVPTLATYWVGWYVVPSRGPPQPPCPFSRAWVPMRGCESYFPPDTPTQTPKRI